jgi:hypothetical protein
MTTFTSSQTIARRFAQAAVDERKEDAMRFFCVALEMIEQGLDLGINRDFLLDTARGLHDALADINHGLAHDLDEVGLEVLDERIDLSDLRQVIAGLS